MSRMVRASSGLAKRIALVSSLFVSTLIILSYQACGGFNSADQGGGTQTLSSSGVTNGVTNDDQLQIVPASASPAAGQALVFSSPSSQFSASAVYSWSYAMSAPSTGLSLSCTEVNGGSMPSFTLICDQTGVLNIEVTVTDQNQVYGPVTLTQLVSPTSSNGTPAPTATPSPDVLAGTALYTSTCASCHGQIANNQLGIKTAAAITSALQSVGAMRNISLTATQIQQIADALN